MTMGCCWDSIFVEKKGIASLQHDLSPCRQMRQLTVLIKKMPLQIDLFRQEQ
jgi:hypothetical protein